MKKTKRLQLGETKRLQLGETLTTNPHPLLTLYADVAPFKNNAAHYKPKRNMPAGWDRAIRGSALSLRPRWRLRRAT